jgi:uncharacterized membrane protein (DUF4010 family)
MLFSPGEFAPWISLALALLIGLLIGAERETAGTSIQIGLRDFVVVSGISYVCATIDQMWLTVIMGLVLGAVLTAHHIRAPKDAGITTEVAMMITFVLAHLVSIPNAPAFKQVGISLAVLIAILLNAKPSVKKFFRETITDKELSDTIWFLALIFVLYPLLPGGRYGPYAFLDPKGLWLSVVLVSGISFVGYFLEKFIGPSVGKVLVGAVGGLMSTTATTVAFAQDSKVDGAQINTLWRAVTITHAVQFVRVFALLFAAHQALAWFFAPALFAAAATGVVVLLLIKPQPAQDHSKSVPLRNPLRLGPALQFAALLAAITLISRASTDLIGPQAVIGMSALAGLVDVDAITLTMSDLVRTEFVSMQLGAISIIVALLVNMVVKAVFARTQGTPEFARRAAISMGIMIAVCVGTLAVVAYF